MAQLVRYILPQVGHSHKGRAISGSLGASSQLFTNTLGCATIFINASENERREELCNDQVAIVSYLDLRCGLAGGLRARAYGGTNFYSLPNLHTLSNLHTSTNRYTFTCCYPNTHPPDTATCPPHTNAYPPHPHSPPPNADAHSTHTDLCASNSDTGPTDASSWHNDSHSGHVHTPANVPGRHELSDFDQPLGV